MKRRLSPWLWIPILGLSLMLVANMAMVLAAKWVGPSRVSAQPYADSARFDEEKARSSAFTAAGGRLIVTSAEPGRLQCRLEVPPGTVLAGPARVLCWRPDAPALDQRMEWRALNESLTLNVPKTGRWRITVDNEKPITSADGMGFRCETIIDAP